MHTAMRVLIGAVLMADPGTALAKASVLDCPVDRLDYVDRKSKRVFSVHAYADRWKYVTADPITDELVTSDTPPPKSKDGRLIWFKSPGRWVMNGYLGGKPAYLVFQDAAFTMPCCSHTSATSLSKMGVRKDFQWRTGAAAPRLRDIRGWPESPANEIDAGPLKGMTLVPHRCRQG